MEWEKWHGSTTVQAAIIMPLFLLMLMTMLMFAMFVYEKAAMRSVCNHIADEGAAIWQRGAAYMSEYYANGKSLPPESQGRIHIYNIYANYFKNLVDTEKGGKLQLLQKHAAQEAARHSFILTANDIDIKVELSNVLIHKKLSITLNADYNLPFYQDHCEVSAECVISAQTELIRTIDFAADMLDGPMRGIKEKYGKVIEKLQELIRKVEIEKN